MIPYLQEITPNATEEFWQEIVMEYHSLNELSKLTIPVYQKHFTENEALELIAFYNTELGKKLVSVMPLISQESFQIGERWGKQAVANILDKYNRKYPSSENK